MLTIIVASGFYYCLVRLRTISHNSDTIDDNALDSLPDVHCKNSTSESSILIYNT